MYFSQWWVTMKKLSSVSCVICHHRGLLIDNAIDSIMKSLEVDIEIVIATSCRFSEQRLKEKYPSIKVFFCEGGPARKRNVATRFSSHEHIAFLDDDVEVTPYALFYMLQEVQNPHIGMVYGKLLNMEFHNRFDEAGSYLTWTGFLWARAESGVEDHGQFEQVVPILAGKSASCIVRRKVFWSVGGFDESFEILGEETDLSWRIWLRGFKVLFCPKSVTYHAFNTRFKPVDMYVPKRIYFNGCRNYLSMLITNLSGLNLIIPAATQTIVWCASAIGFILTGKYEAGLYIFKGIAYVIAHLSTILKKRKIVQSTRTVSDAELLPQITLNPPWSYYAKRFVQYIRTGRHG